MKTRRGRGRNRGRSASKPFSSRDRLVLVQSRRLRFEPLEERALLTAVPLEPVLPPGSLVYQGSQPARLDAGGETDSLAVDLNAGQTLSVVVDPDATLQPTIQLQGPGNGSIAAATAAAPGEDAVLQVVPVTDAGTYTVTVGGAGGSTGQYTVQLILNAAVEQAEHDGPGNDGAASAEDLDGSFLALGAGTAERGAVIGSLPLPVAGQDWYRFTLDDGQSSTLALTAQGPGDTRIELYDSEANQLATGRAATNVDHVINNFVDATNDASPATYLVRVLGSGGDYGLLVTRDVDFDTEPNDGPAQGPQDITSRGSVLGHLGQVSESGFADPPGTERDEYTVSVRAGDELVITTATPGDGAGEFVNALDPVIELYGPSGTLVAGDDNGAPDGRNATLTHTAAAAGRYLVRVRSADDTSGEYLLDVTGHSGSGPSFEVVATQPDDAEVLASAPSLIRVDFNQTLLVTSVDASDLTIGGLPAVDVASTDHNTIVLRVPAGLADGVHHVDLPAGAILDVRGTPVEAFRSSFTLDTTPPVVTVFPRPTFDATPSLSGTIDEAEATIEVTVDGNAYTAINHGDGRWTLADDAIDLPLAPGVYDVRATATDTVGHVGTDATVDELTVWPRAGIRGTSFDDLDGDGVRDDDEPGLAGVTIYLDLNRNGRLEPGEPSTVTGQDDPRTPDADETGTYVFTGLDAGSYVVAEVVPEGWQQTAPNLIAQATLQSVGWVEVRDPRVSCEPPASPRGSRASTHPTASTGCGFLSSQTGGSDELIRLDEFRADPRFTGIEGRSYAAVILDTGVDLDHPFFGPDADGDGVADRIVYQYDFVDKDNDAGDDDGHGCHVTSVVASEDFTFTGMAPKVDVIALRVMNKEDEGDFGDVEEALKWVIDHAATYNVVSVNMSLGDGENHTAPQTRYGIANELARLAEINVIVVSSSGNDFYEQGSSPGVVYPAADPNSLSVGAVYVSGSRGYQYKDDEGNPSAEAFSSGADRIAPFSQRDALLTTVFAPGAPITGAGPDGETVSYHGTSQAAAHISGIAVLAQELATEHLGRRLTPTEFSDLLRNTGVTIHDGDDEDDNVTHTGLDFPRVDVPALAEGILALADEPGRHVVRLGLEQVLEGVDFGNRTRELTSALGPVDFERFNDLEVTEYGLWYSMETVREGLLTLLAGSAGSTDAVELALYAENPLETEAAVPLVTSSPVDGGQRIDWQVGAAETYYFGVKGTGDGVDLSVANLLSHVGSEVSVYGTEEADQFQFDASSPRVVTINGIGYEFDVGEAGSVTFEGGLGEDSAELRGTPGEETVTLNPASAVFTGEGFEVNVADTGEITVFGEGGYDQAAFNDSAGDDTFVGTPTYAALSGEGFYNRARFFEKVSAQSRHGVDVAKFYDSVGNDSYVATPTYNAVSGEAFENVVRYFEGVHVYATAGGVDVAKFYDSTGNDDYVATPTYAALYNTEFQEQNTNGFYSRAKFFEGVHAYATGGGSDLARFYDSSANDDFVATPTYAALFNTEYKEEYTNGFYNRAKFFRGAHAYATAGGSDLARLYDSPGDDVFSADPLQGALYNDTYQQEHTDGFYNRAKFFEGVHAYATAGGADEARLHGSADNDKFHGNATESAMYLPGRYYARAKFFEKVVADAHQGDADRAEMAGFLGMEPEGNRVEFSFAGPTLLCWLMDFEDFDLPAPPAQHGVRQTAADKERNDAVDLLLTLDGPGEEAVL